MIVSSVIFKHRHTVRALHPPQDWSEVRLHFEVVEICVAIGTLPYKLCRLVFGSQSATFLRTRLL